METSIQFHIIKSCRSKFLCSRDSLVQGIGGWVRTKSRTSVEIVPPNPPNFSSLFPRGGKESDQLECMRSAVEAKHGRLKDREAPSKGMIASKLEQVEDGAPIAEDLREVTSFADSEVEAYNAIIDPSMGFLRIRPGKTTTTPPSTPEELRLRHRRIGLAWDFVKARHSTRAWLPTSSVDTFRKLSDYVLGASVAGLRAADQRSPTWSLVLTYELEEGKAAYRFVRDGDCACIDSAIEKAMDSPKLLTEHFVVPFTLGKSFSPASGSLAHEKGFGKGKQMPSWDRQWGKSSKTPEGKPICFKFQKGRCSDKACRFAHACQR